MKEIAGIVLLATVIEGFISWVFGAKEGYETERKWIRWVSLALGVAVAFAYGVDIPAMAGLQSPFPIASAILSGIVIGRGSNYLNDIVTRIRR